MKVALLVPGFSAHERDFAIPALEDCVRRLAREAEVHIFSLRWPIRHDVYRLYGSTVHAMGGGHRLGVKVVALWRSTVRAIVAEHRHAPFHILHAFWADEPGWIAAWLGPLLGVPVVVSIAGGELVALRDIDYGLERLVGRRWVVRWSLRRASSVTAGSDYMMGYAKARLGGWLSAKLWKTPLGVELDRFAPSTADRPDRRRPVLVVGGLSPVKDHARAIRLLPGLPAGVRLRIAGDGVLKAALVSLTESLGVGDRVEWLGTVPHESMPAVYHAASVLAQVSVHEAQGLAVLEAAACGLPVVGTPVGVLPEIGIAARTDDELRRTLIELMADEDRRVRIGRECRERVEREFSAAACVNRFLELYARCGLSHTTS